MSVSFLRSPVIFWTRKQRQSSYPYIHKCFFVKQNWKTSPLLHQQCEYFGPYKQTNPPWGFCACSEHLWLWHLSHRVATDCFGAAQQHASVQRAGQAAQPFDSCWQIIHGSNIYFVQTLSPTAFISEPQNTCLRWNTCLCLLHWSL